MYRLKIKNKKLKYKYEKRKKNLVLLEWVADSLEIMYHKYTTYRINGILFW